MNSWYRLRAWAAVLRARLSDNPFRGTAWRLQVIVSVAIVAAAQLLGHLIAGCLADGFDWWDLVTSGTVLLVVFLGATLVAWKLAPAGQVRTFNPKAMRQKVANAIQHDARELGCVDLQYVGIACTDLMDPVIFNALAFANRRVLTSGDVSITLHVVDSSSEDNMRRLARREQFASFSEWCSKLDGRLDGVRRRLEAWPASWGECPDDQVIFAVRARLKELKKKALSSQFADWMKDGAGHAEAIALMASYTDWLAQSFCNVVIDRRELVDLPSRRCWWIGGNRGFLGTYIGSEESGDFGNQLPSFLVVEPPVVQDGGHVAFSGKRLFERLDSAASEDGGE